VLTALWDFHRREWAYFAFHCGHLTKASDEGEAGEGDESAEVCKEVANLQKSAGEGGVIAKIGGVKLQKSAGIFAIMSVTLSGFGKEL